MDSFPLKITSRHFHIEENSVSCPGCVTWPKRMDALYPTFGESAAEPRIPCSFYMESGLSSASGIRFYNDSGNRVSAFAPGMASLLNSSPSSANVRHKDNEHGVTFMATQFIPAGSELLLNYGYDWHRRHAKRMHSLRHHSSLETFTAFLEREFDDETDMVQGDKKKFRDEQDVRNEMKKVLEEMNRSRTEKDSNREEALHAAEDDEEEEYNDEEKEYDEGEEEEENEHDDDTTVDLTKIEWLSKNGFCVDNIYAGQSSLPGTGQGAFARRLIRKGTLVAPAPLLVLKREDLVIYEAKPHLDMYDDVLNFDNVEGLELLLNYCYGLADSSLLILPYSPIVNFINHNDTAPNAEIRWPEGKSMLDDPKDWLDLHPLDVLDKSGQLMIEFVALRDIQPGEEIFIDYCRDWEDAWRKHEGEHESTSTFRHEIGVPDGFFPDVWKVKSLKYELAPRKAPLKAGEVLPMRWAHNGKVMAEHMYFFGLPQGFSARTREFSDRLGASALYKQLFKTRVLKSNEWFTIDGGELGTWTVTNYAGNDVHDISPWDETSRVSWLRFLGQNGFDTVLDGVGRYFGFTHLTCYFNFYVGLTKSSKINKMHADVYATGNSGFNILWPYMLVNGSKPELLLQSDDANIVLPVHYEYDVAFALGDYGYHMTNTIDYGDTGQMRIVVGTYCSQIDERNSLVHKYLCAGDEPVPFLGDYDRIFNEIHWGQGHSLPK